jgi:hypothetical protein
VAPEELTAFRAAIAPVPPGVPRPEWSVMIPTYHCAGYLRETLARVLAQDPGPETMQIEVVDDHSTVDDPEAVVREVGGGRVGFFRQERNVGHTRNFDTCIQRARGRLVHLLHGDDYVLDGFYRTMAAPFARHPEIGAAFCRNVFIEEDGRTHATARLLQEESGILDGWVERIASRQLLQPPAMVVRREVYEHLGGFDRRILTFGEDWEMWVRIAASYPVYYEVEPLAVYRLQDTRSLSGRALRTGQNMRDLRTAVEINAALLPVHRRARISRAAHANNALGTIRRAHRMLDAGEVRVPLIQLREALRTSTSPRVLLEAARLVARCGWTALRRAGGPR